MISKESTALYKKRARELVAQMTLTEKISQMMNKAPEIKRLGIKSYNWWNEALTGLQERESQRFSRRQLHWPQPLIPNWSIESEMWYPLKGVLNTTNPKGSEIIIYIKA